MKAAFGLNYLGRVSCASLFSKQLNSSWNDMSFQSTITCGNTIHLRRCFNTRAFQFLCSHFNCIMYTTMTDLCLIIKQLKLHYWLGNSMTAKGAAKAIMDCNNLTLNCFQLWSMFYLSKTDTNPTRFALKSQEPFQYNHKLLPFSKITYLFNMAFIITLSSN